MKDQLSNISKPEGDLSAPVAESERGQLSSFPGDLTRLIGSGTHAQASIVFWTIRASFVSGGVLSLVVVIWALWKGESLTGLKDIWSIFVPIITLTLGYFFGRGR